MRKRPTLLMTRLRGIIAALMVVTLGIVSLSAVFARAAQASSVVHADVPVITALSGRKAVPAKMCHRMALPGAANTCPLSSFSVGVVLGAADGSLFPPVSVAAGWRRNDASLRPQQFTLGLYRPPRALA